MLISFISWRTKIDPSLDLYYLHLKPPLYTQFDFSSITLFPTGPPEPGPMTHFSTSLKCPSPTSTPFTSSPSLSTLVSLNMPSTLNSSPLPFTASSPSAKSTNTLGIARFLRGESRRKGFERKVLGGVVSRMVMLLGVVVVTLLVIMKKRDGKKGLEKEAEFVLVLNLKVFSYKEFLLTTQGFLEKVGHGGFEIVFQGELSDNSIVAMKRLERPRGGEKKFRAYG
ncbi:hypothetical protein VNO78_10540 [Psophocarpus tetragonolobus]|uniref:Uncharacterized protein n=1 Tax=Psophocarpus tetragonolobus TaxID=3891 RepID=A0AAN9SRK3_PSOTE